MSNFNEIKDILSGIADSVRDKKGSLEDIPAKKLAEEISTIKTEADLASKTVTANGVYTASDDSLDGYNLFEVAVPKYTELYLTSKMLRPDDFDKSVPGILQTRIQGLGDLVVPGPTRPQRHNCMIEENTEIFTSLTLLTENFTVTENGEYDLANLSLDGFVRKLNVNVPISTENAIQVFPLDGVDTTGGDGSAIITSTTTQVTITQKLSSAQEFVSLNNISNFDIVINAIWATLSLQPSNLSLVSYISISQKPWSSTITITYMPGDNLTVFSGEISSAVYKSLDKTFTVTISNIQKVKGPLDTLLEDTWTSAPASMGHSNIDVKLDANGIGVYDRISGA